VAPTRAPATRPRRQSGGARRVSRSRRRLRVVWVLAPAAVAVYLYYQPLASYLDTRDELASTQREVESLRVAKSALELRLANATSTDATRREARRIGYVQPGERLFVVKGIPDWRRDRSSAQEDRPAPGG
jgi:cell division protein FtsB